MKTPRAYGVAVAFVANDGLNLMVEVAGESDTDFDEEFLELRAGFDATLTGSVHLLFSTATGIRGAERRWTSRLRRVSRPAVFPLDCLQRLLMRSHENPVVFGREHVPGRLRFF